MKNRIATLIGIFSVLITMAIIILAYLMVNHPNKMKAINQLTEKKPLMHQLVVIDFDDSGLLDEAELKQGIDGVITVNNPGNGINGSFNSVSALQKLDANKDGVIDAKDPLYRYMELVFFDKVGNKHHTITFAQAGIKAIKIEQNRLAEPTKDQSMPPHPKGNIIGEAIFTNGQRHSVRLIMVSGVAE